MQAITLVPNLFHLAAHIAVGSPSIALTLYIGATGYYPPPFARAVSGLGKKVARATLLVIPGLEFAQRGMLIALIGVTLVLRHYHKPLTLITSDGSNVVASVPLFLDPVTGEITRILVRLIAEFGVLAHGHRPSVLGIGHCGDIAVIVPVLLNLVTVQLIAHTTGEPVLLAILGVLLHEHERTVLRPHRHQGQQEQYRCKDNGLLHLSVNRSLKVWR